MSPCAAFDRAAPYATVRSCRCCRRIATIGQPSQRQRPRTPGPRRRRRLRPIGPLPQHPHTKAQRRQRPLAIRPNGGDDVAGGGAGTRSMPSVRAAQRQRSPPRRARKTSPLKPRQGKLRAPSQASRQRPANRRPGMCRGDAGAVDAIVRAPAAPTKRPAQIRPRPHRNQARNH